MKALETKNRIAILGSSKGLGYQTYRLLHGQYPEADFLCVSRKIQQVELYDRTQILTADFSKSPVDPNIFETIRNFHPTDIIYSAGGGPYGFFQDKKISDHEWAMNVNFMFPMALVKNLADLQMRQMIFIGSSIAENQPDPKAASYCAAKHALRGLMTTLQVENTLPFKVRLFSPGYIATDLLPVHSPPRQLGLARPAQQVAEDLISFFKSEQINWP